MGVFCLCLFFSWGLDSCPRNPGDFSGSERKAFPVTATSLPHVNTSGFLCFFHSGLLFGRTWWVMGLGAVNGQSPH